MADSTSWKSSADTYVTRKGVSPNTCTEISSKTKIWAVPTVNGMSEDSSASSSKVQIGVIAAFDPNESRNVETVRGIGFGDQVAELVPGNTEPMTISVQRAAQYLSNIFQVFGYKGGISGLVRSLKHHRWPFDIVKETVFSEVVQNFGSSALSAGDEISDSMDTTRSVQGNVLSDGYSALQTYLEGCWFTSYSTSYSSDTVIVTENADISVSDIWDGLQQVVPYEDADTGNALLSGRFGTSTD